MTLSPDELAAGLMPRDVDGLKPDERAQLLELARFRNVLELELHKAYRHPVPPEASEAYVSGYRIAWTVGKLAAMLAIQEKSAVSYVRAKVKARLLGIVDAKILEVK